MSLLPSATFAGPSPAEALWAVAGSSGPGGGVTQLLAGTGITLDPLTGEGVVTINASGGGGGITAVTGTGNGIIVNTVGTAVTVQNSGVTQLTAGAGISLDGATGNLTITNTASSGATVNIGSPQLNTGTIIDNQSGTNVLVPNNAKMNVVSQVTIGNVRNTCFNFFAGNGGLGSAQIWIDVTALIPQFTNPTTYPVDASSVQNYSAVISTGSINNDISILVSSGANSVRTVPTGSTAGTSIILQALTGALNGWYAINVNTPVVF
jgi:hypothetical protein